ncbi:MAG: stage II sporulation protein M [Chloroflexales bacterium]|nr:stage II sporulation protein M [Chloroflexales bacterium]
MNFQAVATITRREVRETLSDWRIVLPVLLLTLLLPQLLVAASRLVIRFVDDPNLVSALVPFAALLVGFVPSSFSLITALESFVGERERNSLESLLAMPLDDRDLFFGKLCSALFTPLLASYGAMVVFTGLLFLVDPAMYLGAITPARLALLFLMIGLLALAMVAGAVVISTRTSSIRAANLLSSFVLIPASLIVQVEAFLIINGRWDVMWIIIAALAVLSALLVRSGLAGFNREAILAREHRQIDLGPLTGLLRLDEGRRTKDEGRRTNDQYSSSLVVRPVSAVRHILGIMGREVRETLSDWRILLPILVLTVALPLALVSGVPFAVRFLESQDLVAQLVPFVILLVGFVPSSFSLITALESFVGERERNSLESLLAMPVSDGSLYLAKLGSSLVPPLITSYVGMLVFAAGTASAHPQIYSGAMDGVRLVQLLLMITVMTVVMVAGAVIISSHTSSIRAATLLASGILVPMATLLMTQSVLIIARRWDVLWIIIPALMVVAVAFARTGMAAFNREEILSREHEQLNLQHIKATFRTFFSEYRPAGISPDTYVGLPFSPRRFYQSELGPLLRELRLPILVAVFAALAGLVAGGYVGSTYRVRALDAALAEIGQAPGASVPLALLVFANNLRVSLLAPLFSAISFGLFSFLVPAVAFAQIGYVASTLATRGGSLLEMGAGSPLQFVLAYVLPHGIVELPTFILCAALGLRMGAALLAPPKGFTVAQNLLWSTANFVKVWLLVVAPLVLVGALIEGLITPHIIAWLY